VPKITREIYHYLTLITYPLKKLRERTNSTIVQPLLHYSTIVCT